MWFQVFLNGEVSGDYVLQRGVGEEVVKVSKLVTDNSGVE
jgi:hypothetical protein